MWNKLTGMVVDEAKKPLTINKCSWLITDHLVSASAVGVATSFCAASEAFSFISCLYFALSSAIWKSDIISGGTHPQRQSLIFSICGISPPVVSLNEGLFTALSILDLIYYEMRNFNFFLQPSPTSSAGTSALNVYYQCWHSAWTVLHEGCHACWLIVDEVVAEQQNWNHRFQSIRFF